MTKTAAGLFKLGGIVGVGFLTLSILALLDMAPLAFGGKPSWFIWCLGIGFLVFSILARLGFPVAGTIALTMITGGAAQLWLTQPLWFPALRFSTQGAVDLVMFALVGVQTCVALWVLIRGRSFAKVGPFLSTFGVIRVIAFLLLSGAFTVSILGFVPRGYVVSYVLHLIAGSALIGINLLSVAALLSQPLGTLGIRRIPPLSLALFTLVASALMAWFSFERLPHVEDELIYLFQAKTFAGGAFSVPAPPIAVQPGLEYYLLEISEGRWFATTPPGWTMVLAIGVMFGVPWLVNPLLAAGTVLLAHAVTAQISDTRRADIVALLLATSPWFLGASGSLMGHNIAIFCTLASWWMLLMAPATLRRTVLLALTAGVAMGWVFTTRQLEGALVGTLAGIWLLSSWRQSGAIIRTIAYSGGAVLGASVYFIHNAALTGNALLSPLARYVDDLWSNGANAYGFGPDIGPPSGWGALDVAKGHSPTEALMNTGHNLSALQLELLGWGTGSLALVFAFLLWGRITRRDTAMLILSATIIVAMFLYWFSGGFYIGPRYWFGLIYPVLFLSAGGYIVLTQRLEALSVSGSTVHVTLLVLCIIGGTVFTSWRGVEKYYTYGNYSADVRNQRDKGIFGNAVVFVNLQDNEGSALFLNDPWLTEDKPIFLMDLGEATNAGAAAAFPTRKSMGYAQLKKAD